jgi:hypothetical protein
MFYVINENTPVGVCEMIADTPYAGMTRIRLKGRCGVTHPLSPLARTPLDIELFNYKKDTTEHRNCQ